MRRFLLLCCLIALASTSLHVGPALAQGGTTPRLISESKINDARDVKFPAIAAAGTTVHVAGGANQRDALYWTKTDTATTFGAAFRVGTIEGQPDYNTAAVAAAPDGTVYYTWVNNATRRIYLRQRSAAGAWGPQRDVFTSSDFAFFPQVAVATDGAVFVTWQELLNDNAQPVRVRRSTDGGATWSGTLLASQNKVFSSPPTIAAGPSGQIAIAYTDVDFRIFVSLWNGSGFTSEGLTGTGIGSNPSVSFGPDGKVYAAWRGIDDDGENAGAFYAERQSTNTWAAARLVSGSVKGTVNIVADANGTLHFGWVAPASGGLRFYYAYKAAGQAASNPISSNLSLAFNSRLAITISDQTYAHAAIENFEGTVPFIYYDLFAGAAGAATAVAATPVIEGDKEQIKRQDTVSVSFKDVRGTPTEVRWNWGSAPSDNDNDSGNWQTFVNPISVTVPSAVLDAADCKPVRLYTQVRDAQQVTESAGKFDAVVIDAGITAAVAATNPHMLRKSSQFTGPTGNARLGDLSSDGGASDGAPNYTRDPLFYLELQGQADCSGLKDVASGRSTTTVAPAITVQRNFFANVLPIGGPLATGENQLLVRVSDAAGNFQDFPQTFVYDTAAPQLEEAAPGTLSVASNPDATLLASLTFSDIQVTDDLYPGRGYWGVWVANSRSQVSNPTTDTNLNWLALKAPDDDDNFTINGWSLSSGLPTDQVTPGSYYVYVRFLDGAGNPTTGFLTATVSLDKVTRPALYLPLIKRQ